MDWQSERWGAWFVVIPLSAAFGMAFSWWINRPPTLWMEFDSLNAVYESGRPSILTSGRYYVNDPCDPEKVIWRIEAIATDGQVANYGPKEPKPSLTKGAHFYSGSIPLEEKIRPDGWAVRILVTCPGEIPETIASEPAVVREVPQVLQRSPP